MKKFLIITGLLLSSPGSFSDPVKTFPTPKGFTTDRSKAFTMTVHIPPQIEKLLTRETHRGLFLTSFCHNLRIKPFKYTGNNEKYILNIMGSNTYYDKNGNYKIVCKGMWTKRKATGNITDIKSPTYYIMK